MENGSGHHKNYAFGEFNLETELQSLRRGAAQIHLAKRPFDVLLFLIENRERVVSRDELLNKFWDGHDVYDDALRKCVGAIRKALDDTEKSPRFVETRRGSGYRFVGTVSAETQAVGGGRRQVERRANDGGQHLKDEGQETKNEKQKTGNESQILSAKLISRPIFVLVLAVCSIAFVALAFFVNRPPPKNAGAQTLTETVAARRSIAILPIKNLTGEAANDYLSDGITESLINEVSRLESLRVISRSSAFQFKNRDVPAQEIGEKLGVETILEGGLRKSGEQLRVEVRLVNVKDGSVLWASDSAQKKLADIFAMQDGIACQIVAELKIRLCGENPSASRYTPNAKAYQLYLQGLYYRNRLGAEDLKKAIEFYNQALQIDPNYALAHEGLATVYMVSETNSIVIPGTAAPLAEFHANKALELDDSLAGAYMVLGTVKTLNSYDSATQENYYRQALAKNPNYLTAHLWLSNIYTVRGEFEKAEAELFRVREVDPLSFGVQLNLAELYYYWRKPDKAIEQAELMLVAYPDESFANTLIAESYIQKGMLAEATAAINKTPSDNPKRILILAADGLIDEARAFTESLAKSDAAKNSPYFVGCAFALIGDKETAFEWLEKSYKQRQADLVSIKVDPALDSLRGDARYTDLLRRVNLAE